MTAPPPRGELFLIRTRDAELALRSLVGGGVTPYSRVLAQQVGNVLYIPELELVWYNVGRRLFVLDTRPLPEGSADPVLIASDVPIVGGLRVQRDGVAFVEPGDESADEEDLVLHWGDEPWLQGGEERERIDALDGRAWLSTERRRPLRSVATSQRFDASGEHVALPAGRARCDGTPLCGAALPFGPRGWQLLVADEDEGGDFPEYGCLLHDPHAKAFATPPEARSWGPARDAASGACGPFLFDAQGSTYLASGVACRIGGGCTSLDEGTGLGWLEPGVTVGMY